MESKTKAEILSVPILQERKGLSDPPGAQTQSIRPAVISPPNRARKPLHRLWSGGGEGEGEGGGRGVTKPPFNHKLTGGDICVSRCLRLSVSPSLLVHLYRAIISAVQKVDAISDTKPQPNAGRYRPSPRTHPAYTPHTESAELIQPFTPHIRRRESSCSSAFVSPAQLSNFHHGFQRRKKEARSGRVKHRIPPPKKQIAPGLK